MEIQARRLCQLHFLLHTREGVVLVPQQPRGQDLDAGAAEALCSPSPLARLAQVVNTLKRPSLVLVGTGVASEGSIR